MLQSAGADRWQRHAMTPEDKQTLVDGASETCLRVNEELNRCLKSERLLLPARHPRVGGLDVFVL